MEREAERKLILRILQGILRTQCDWGWNPIPIAIKGNIVTECKPFNLLLSATFPNPRWKSTTQLSPSASLPGLCLKNENGKMHVCLYEICASFSEPWWKRMWFWNVICYGLNTVKFSRELISDQSVSGKYMGAFLNDGDARFRTLWSRSSEGSFMARWLVWLSCGQDPYLIAGSANLFAEAGLFL